MSADPALQAPGREVLGGAYRGEEGLRESPGSLAGRRSDRRTAQRAVPGSRAPSTLAWLSPGSSAGVRTRGAAGQHPPPQPTPARRRGEQAALPARVATTVTAAPGSLRCAGAPGRTAGAAIQAASGPCRCATRPGARPGRDQDAEPPTPPAPARRSLGEAAREAGSPVAEAGPVRSESPERAGAQVEWPREEAAGATSGPRLGERALRFGATGGDHMFGDVARSPASGAGGNEKALRAFYDFRVVASLQRGQKRLTLSGSARSRNPIEVGGRREGQLS